MKKSLNTLQRPKQQKSFFDNYRSLLTAMAFLLISFFASAQIHQPPSVWGKAEERTVTYKAMQGPTGNGAPTSTNITAKKNFGLYLDSTNFRLYVYNPKTALWSYTTVTGSFDATVDFSVNTDPNTVGTTFSPNTPMLTTVIYVSTINGSQWTWNGAAYVIYNQFGWGLFGNVVTASNFLGTTNTQPLRFRAGNVELGKINGDGNGNVMFGNGAIASGNLAMAYGNTVTASGQYSLATGNSTQASGYGGASTFGSGTVANGFGTMAIGQWNTNGASADQFSFNLLNKSFVVGVGTGSGARADGFTMLFNGKTTLHKYGIGTFTGTPATYPAFDATGNLIEVTGGGVGGSGTLNFLSKFTPNGTTLGNSQLFDDGTYVGIGTVAPGTALQVNIPGTANTVTNLLTLSNDLTGAGSIGSGAGIQFKTNGVQALAEIVLKTTDVAGNNDTEIRFRTQASAGGGLQNRMTINPIGNVGLGTITPAYKLDVNGNAKITSALTGDTSVTIGNTDFYGLDRIVFKPFTRTGVDTSNQSFRFVHSSHRFGAGNQADETMQSGWNIMGDGFGGVIPENDRKPMIYTSMEQRYINTGVDNVEYGISWKPANEPYALYAGTGKRRLDWFYMNSITGASQNDINVGTINYRDTANYASVFGQITPSLVSFTPTINFGSLTASRPVFTDASKNLTSTGPGTTSQYIRGDGSLATYGTSTSVPISGLTAATGINTIDNGNYLQTWQWPGLTSGNGLTLHSFNNIATTGSSILNITRGGTLSGTNTIYGASIESSHDGGATTNVALTLNGSGGITNHALYVSAGTVNLQPLTATTILGLDGSKNIKSVALSGLTYDGTTLTASTGTVTGTGTTNNMTKWTSSTAIGNALMTDDGTVLRVGEEGINTSFYLNGVAEFMVGDIDNSGSGHKLMLLESSSKMYYDNIAHDAKFGINKGVPTVALDVVGAALLSSTLGVTGHTTIGGGATASELRLLEPSASGANYSAFKAVAQAGNITYSLPPTAVAGGVWTDVSGNGVLTSVVPTAVPILASGTYTPTVGNESNCTVTIYDAGYSQVGTSVTVFGKLGIAPTVTATSTTFEIDLPVITSFTGDTEAGGTGWAPAIAGLGFGVISISGESKVLISFLSTDINDNDFSYSFTYQVL